MEGQVAAAVGAVGGAMAVYQLQQAVARQLAIAQRYPWALPALLGIAAGIGSAQTRGATRMLLIGAMAAQAMAVVDSVTNLYFKRNLF